MEELINNKTAAIDAVTELFTRGSITIAEFEEGVEQINRCVTGVQLIETLGSLARNSQAFGVLLRANDARSREPVRIECDASAVKKKGDWVRAGYYEIKVASGSVVLDFREYEFTTNFRMEIDIEGTASTIKLIVPEDFAVEDRLESTAMSTVKNKIPQGNPGSGRITITGRLSLSSLVVKYK